MKTIKLNLINFGFCAFFATRVVFITPAIVVLVGKD